MKARIAAVGAYLPEQILTSEQVERRIEGYTPQPGIVQQLSGVRARHVARDDQQCSDLAIEAIRRLDPAADPATADLLIFASASQDLIEPATAHIVAAKLGLSCPVFDVKNACNSLINGIQVAEALIRTGAHRTVLVCSGELPSRAVRWRVRDRAQFLRSYAGYTLSDAGAAVLVTADPERGIFYRDFCADSTAWDVGGVFGGGSRHLVDPEHIYFSVDMRRMRRAFWNIGADLFRTALKDTGLTWQDFAVVAVHQVGMVSLKRLGQQLDLPEDRLVVTVAEHGNCASATLALQLATAGWRDGDKIALLGIGGGISLGVMLAEM